jgi:indole-3-glycerol phosphate synthase
MDTILDKIIRTKKEEVEEAKRLLPIDELKKQKRVRKHYSLKDNLLNSRSGIIAEFKRKSPSKGWINRDAVSKEIVSDYEKAGASCSSILTDYEYFGGKKEDLITAGEVVELPLLRKDFIIDEYQIIEANIMGADVILLIASCLTPRRVEELANVAKKQGLEVLLEIHNEEEINHICDSVTFVGVNNRNLHTFTTSLDVSVSLSGKIPDKFIKISESGISTYKDILFLQKYGFKGFLVGESFMKTKNPGKSCKSFIDSI